MPKVTESPTGCKGIRATPPVVAFNGDEGSYSVDQTVTIVCSASDTLSVGNDLLGASCALETAVATSAP